MFIRSRMANVDLLGNEAYEIVLQRTNLYPTAFPFSRASLNGPYSVAFVALHGKAPAVTSLTDLWIHNIVRTWPSSGFTIGVSSSSANDTNSSGSGARQVQVDFLDTDYKLHSIILNLNGQTKVSDTTFVGSVLRINGARVVSIGSGTTNAGDIYVYDSSDTVTAGVPQTSTKIFHRIGVGEVVGRGGFYTVPKGCRMQLQQFRGGIIDANNTNQAGTMSLFTQVPMSGVMSATTFPISGQVDSSNGMISVDPDFPLVFEEKTDLAIRAQCSASAALAAYIDAVLFYAA